MKKIIFLFILFLYGYSFAGRYTNNTSGDFDDPAIWDGGVAPSASSDSFVINVGTVIYTNQSQRLTTNSWNASVINGKLWMTNSCYFRFNGNITGTGSWDIGSAETNIMYNGDTNPPVMIEMKSGTIMLSGTNVINWYGEPRSNLYTMLSQDVAVGDTNIYVIPPFDVRSNDVVVMSSGQYSLYSTYDKQHVVDSFDGSNLVFSQSFDSYTNQYIYSGFSISNVKPARVKEICGVACISRPIEYFAVKAAYANYAFSNAAGMYVQGVRFFNFAAVIGAGHAAVISNCVVQGNNNTYGSGGGYTVNSGNLATNVRIYSSVLSGVYGGLGGLRYGYAEGCVGIANSGCSVSPYLYGSFLTNCVGFDNAYGTAYAGGNSEIWNCKEYGSSAVVRGSRGIRVYNSTAVSSYLAYDNRGNYYENCVSTGTPSSSGASMAYTEVLSTFVSCRSYLQSAAGLSWGGDGNRFVGCVASNTVTPAFSTRPTDEHFEDCVNELPSVPVCQYYYYTDNSVPSGAFDSSCTTVFDKDSRSYYTTGGYCSSQTNVVSESGGFTFKHQIESYYYGEQWMKECWWYEDDLVRPYGTARWDVWMRKDYDGQTQRAAISILPEIATITSDFSYSVACVTNTSETNLWFVSNISYYNTNSYPQQVRLIISLNGPIATKAYSSAIKFDDRALKIMP